MNQPPSPDLPTAEELDHIEGEHLGGEAATYPETARLVAAARYALAAQEVLRLVEWQPCADEDRPLFCCSACGAYEREGHTSDCALAALLPAADEPPA